MDGTSTSRTSVASIRMATAHPSPVCCTVDTPVNTKVAKTAAIVTAAAVIVRALLESASATARGVSP